MKISEAFKQYQRGRKDHGDTIADAMAHAKKTDVYKKVVKLVKDVTTDRQRKNGTFCFQGEGRRIYTLTSQGFLRYEEAGNTLSRGRYRTDDVGDMSLTEVYVNLLGRLLDVLTKRDKSAPIKEEALVESVAIGPFWPAEAKLRKLRRVLDLPAAILMTPRIWNVIEAALADRMTMKDITALDEEIAARLAEKDGKSSK
jgi:hypothetical protein